MISIILFHNHLSYTKSSPFSHFRSQNISIPLSPKTVRTVLLSRHLTINPWDWHIFTYIFHKHQVNVGKYIYIYLIHKNQVSVGKNTIHLIHKNQVNATQIYPNSHQGPMFFFWCRKPTKKLGSNLPDPNCNFHSIPMVDSWPKRCRAKRRRNLSALPGSRWVWTTSRGK